MVEPGLMALMRMPFGPLQGPQLRASAGVCSASGQMGRRSYLAAMPMMSRWLPGFIIPGQNGIHGVDVGEVLGIHSRMPCIRAQVLRQIAFGCAGRVDQHIHRPIRSSTSATMTFAAALPVRSQGRASRSPGEAGRSRSAESRFAGLRETMATRPPSSRKARAQARPMPLLPP